MMRVLGQRQGRGTGLGLVHLQLLRVHQQTASLAKDAGFEEVDDDDVANLLTSHTQELTDEDLFHLEKHRERETSSDSEGAPIAKKFTTKELSELTDDGRRLAEKVIEFDPQFDRALDFKTIIMDGLSRYEKLYQQKKASAAQKISDFFKPLSSLLPSTSSSTSGLLSYFKTIEEDVYDPVPVSPTIMELPSSSSDQKEAGVF
ncbi:hypothetical protein O3P69_008580 [Scylla paramamosain]|uniref:Uncharacterized protein n=1 Tax=Scylla paramamosain TaxID=85552 RepID=A0AAW0SMF7_SCYPA